MTSVVYVQKQHAKQVKTLLDKLHLLDKRYRMIPVSSSSSTTTTNDNSAKDDDIKDCIAIPVKCIDFMKNDDNDDNLVDIQRMIVKCGVHDCPYSTAMLGNNNKNMMQKNNKSSTESSSTVSSLTHLQYALVETLTSLSSGEDTNAEERVRNLSKRTCPTKLEVIGDDRTLVIPRFAVYVDNPNNEFYKLLYPTIKLMVKKEKDVLNSNNEGKYMFSIQSHLWEVLASIYNTSRQWC